MNASVTTEAKGPDARAEALVASYALKRPLQPQYCADILFVQPDRHIPTSLSRLRENTEKKATAGGCGHLNEYEHGKGKARFRGRGRLPHGTRVHGHE